jgi:hypothetical protein
MPALYGGIIMAIISSVPGLNLLNCLCCAGILLGGAMAVFFYQKDLTPDHPPMTNSDAVQLGLLAGVFGALIGSAISAAIMAAFGNVAGQMIKSMMEQYSDQMPPGTMEKFEEGLKQNGFSFLQVIFALLLDSLFGLLGGLIGFAIWKPKVPPIAPPSYMPPQQ